MIQKLILENYIPLMSSGVSRVELDTRHLVNLLISKNGTGKTSILKELNYWPADNADYENGRKYVEIPHKGCLYVLESRTHLGNGHSFKVYEGKTAEGPYTEHNPGGTFTVQKELGETHFGADLNLLKVLSGIKIVDRISAMPVSRRKDIFMKVYPNDTRYALGVYNKLKAERNDLKATTRKQIERHADENRKLSYIQQYTPEEMEAQIKGIEQELKQALLARGQLESAKIDPSLNTKVEAFKALVDKLTLNRVSGFIFTETEIIEALEIHRGLLEKHQAQAAVIQRMISENASHLEGLEEFIKDPDTFRGQAEILKKDLADTTGKLDRLNEQLDKLPIFQDKELDLSTLVEVAPRFMEYLRRVALVSDPALSGGEYRGYQVRLEKVRAKKRELDITLTDIRHRIRHINGAETIQCPDCSHLFKLGVKPDDLNTLNNQLNAVSEHLDKLDQEERDLVAKVDNDIEWFTSMNQLFTFIRENDHVRVLSELVKEFEVGKVIHTHLCNALELFLTRSKLEEHLSSLNSEKSLIEARISLLDRNNLLDVATYVNRLETELFEENKGINQSTKKIASFERHLATIRNYREDVASLRVLVEEIRIGMDSKDRVNFRGMVDDRITSLTLEKEEKLANIIKNRSLVAVVTSISEDIEKLKRRSLIVETWMDGLCPNRGKIGKMMTDFIEVICANVNAILSEIWDTPLYVLPCSKENGDLTYKFPVMKGNSKPTPDISECSAGEADVIDFAFRLVFLKYQPACLPLIMDEVGISFDEIKRKRFFDYTLSLTQADNPRQMFVVSHYVGVSGGFSKPNIVSLKYEGLTLPGVPNEHSKVA